MKPLAVIPDRPGAMYLRRERVGGAWWRPVWQVVAYPAPPTAGAAPRCAWASTDPKRPRKGQRVVKIDAFRWVAIWLPDLR